MFTGASNHFVFAAEGMTTWGRSLDTVSRARRWFIEPALREVSRPHDDRETAASRRIAAHVALATLGRPPAAILDVGCGDGAMLTTLADACPHSSLVGIDPVAPAIDAARERLAPFADRLTLAERAAEQLFDAPLIVEPGSVDLVLIHLCLGLWEDPVAGLRAAIRSLAPGGLLYAIDLLRPESVAAAEPLLASATSKEESSYLFDQMATSFDREEATALAASLSGENEGVAYRSHVLFGGLGGHAFGSQEARRLWANHGVRDAVEAMGPPDPNDFVKAEYVLHLWVERVDAQ